MTSPLQQEEDTPALAIYLIETRRLVKAGVGYTRKNNHQFIWSIVDRYYHQLSEHAVY